MHTFDYANQIKSLQGKLIFFFCFLVSWNKSRNATFSWINTKFVIMRDIFELCALISSQSPFLAVVDWITKGAAQRGRTEGAMLPARRSAPEHDPCMTSEHSTTDRWIRWESILRGNRSTRRSTEIGFIKRVDKGWITTMKDLESWRFER